MKWYEFKHKEEIEKIVEINSASMYIDKGKSEVSKRQVHCFEAVNSLCMFCDFENSVCTTE